MRAGRILKDFKWFTGIPTIGTNGWRCSQSPLGGRLETTLVDLYFHHYFLFCQTPVQAQQLSPSRTRSWLCFPPVTTTRTTRRRTPTKIYQNEVYYRLGIWNIDLTHKIKTSPSIPGLVTHHPKDSHPSNSTVQSKSDKELTLFSPVTTRRTRTRIKPTKILMKERC